MSRIRSCLTVPILRVVEGASAVPVGGSSPGALLRAHRARLRRLQRVAPPALRARILREIAARAGSMPPLARS